MATRSDSPQVAALMQAVEKVYGKPVRTPSDFVLVADRVETKTGQHISESTVKRLWKPALGYKTVSDHTLDVLAQYTGFRHFKAFAENLSASGIKESEVVSGSQCVRADDLAVGDRIRICWLPDRECVLRYLGDRKFEALTCINSTLRPGDTFFCSTFITGRPLYVDDLTHEGTVCERYAMGTGHGLTSVEKI